MKLLIDGVEIDPSKIDLCYDRKNNITGGSLKIELHVVMSGNFSKYIGPAKSIITDDLGNDILDGSIKIKSYL